MVPPNRFPQVLLWAGLVIGIATGSFAADLKAPGAVKAGLHQLAAEYGDMERKVTAERYDRLPHDNEELHEESLALSTAVASEPAEFKAKVESALQGALTASTHIAEVSATHDKQQVKAALDDLSTQLQLLNALFPENLRTEPGTVKKVPIG